MNVHCVSTNITSPFTYNGKSLETFEQEVKQTNLLFSLFVVGLGIEPRAMYHTTTELWPSPHLQSKNLFNNRAMPVCAILPSAPLHCGPEVE